ncbi:MAG: TetR/AcrR family transcriptional regulator [Spirochaetales bacterium]|nr:TetR/AcrR family transcriptional regulator [Spirochaetales bacterium]
MSRAFSEKEKDEIRSHLLEVGRKLFSIYGLKKTSIDNVVAEAGISKGAFYSFYSMKELFFWDVLNSFEEEIREKFAGFLSGRPLSFSVMKQFLLNMFNVVDQEPLIRRLLEGNDYDLLKRALPDDILDEHLHSDFNFSRSLIDGFVAAGVKMPDENDAVAAMLRSIFFISLHQREIGAGYRQGIELLCDVIAGSFSYPEARE